MMAIGLMRDGSYCSICNKDLSGVRGVQVGDSDFCFDCFEKDKQSNIHKAIG